MASPRELLKTELDANGLVVTGLPPSVNASDAVRRDEMLAGDAAVATAAASLVTAEAVARAAADALIPGTITALTGDVTASGTGAVAAALANLPQAVLLTRLAALTSDPTFNARKLTSLANGVNPQDAATVAQLTAIAGRSLEVDEVADLEAAAFPAIGLCLAKVESFEDLFYLDRGNAQTPDGVTIVLALGGVGRWIRMNIANVIWQGQTDWYWDPVHGNDENSGAIGFPVKTHAEIERRCGDGLMVADTTIHLLGNTNEVPFVRRRSITINNATGQPILYYTCTPAPIAGGSGTVASAVAENKATNTQGTVTVSAFSGGTNWTSLGLVGRFIRFFSGGTPVATTFVDRDLGSGTARLGFLSNVTDTPETVGFGNGYAGGPVVAGNTFQVYTRFSLPAPVVAGNVIVCHHCVGITNDHTSGITSGIASGLGMWMANACEFSVITAGPEAANSWITCCTFVSFDSSDGGGGRLTSCQGGVASVRRGNWQINDLRLSGFSGALFDGFHYSTSAIDIGIFNSTAGVLVRGGYVQFGRLWGSGNTGVALKTLGNDTTIVLVNTPNIVCSGGDIVLNGVTHTFAEALPLTDMAADNKILSAGAV